MSRAKHSNERAEQPRVLCGKSLSEGRESNRNNGLSGRAGTASGFIIPGNENTFPREAGAFPAEAVWGERGR